MDDIGSVIGKMAEMASRKIGDSSQHEDLWVDWVIDPAGDSPFPPGLPGLKRNGGAKPTRNAKNENAVLQPLVHCPLSRALAASANSIEGLAC